MARQAMGRVIRVRREGVQRKEVEVMPRGWKMFFWLIEPTDGPRFVREEGIQERERE